MLLQNCVTFFYRTQKLFTSLFIFFLFFIFFYIQWKSVHSNIIFCVLQQRKKCSEDRIFILGWNSLIELNVCIVLFSYSSVKQNLQEKLQLWFNFTLKYSSIVIF